jgi:hypothetical protein
LSNMWIFRGLRFHRLQCRSFDTYLYQNVYTKLKHKIIS